jgi:serine/threonine protein kinase
MSQDSLIGKQLDEYRIDKPLGAGGMARVYRALDTRLRRYVALKVIAPHFRADSDHAARFEREAQSIARLEHPNIVHIYRFGEVEDLYYIAMQYIEGADVGYLIEDYRSNGEVMPLTDIVQVIQDIGAALDYAHSKGVIHRDVKPSNIIVDSRGQAILTDFGLALLSDLGTQGEVFGSPHYLSPEQAVSSSKVVPQSDLYALGVTLFEMLTGDVPFDGGDSTGIAMQHLSDPPPSPSQINPAVPAPVDAVVLRCLEKEPYDRYQTGAELSSALRQAIVQWDVEDAPSNGGVRRPSLVLIPHKVSQAIEAAHLADMQPTQPNMLPEIAPPSFVNEVFAPTQSAVTPSLAETFSPTTPNLPQTLNNIPYPIRQPDPWRKALLLAGALFLCGLSSICALFVLTRYVNSQIAANVATATAAQAAETETPAPLTVAPTPTEFPTLAPTPTQVTLPNAQPTALPTAMITAPLNPPENRAVVPPNSRRLGEFAVEAYCNIRGLGVVLINNQRDWACTNPDGTVASVLGPADFDSICRARYNSPSAFAIQDQTKEVQAYNWSCYEYVAEASISEAMVTPSLTTLRLRGDQDWIALVNTSSSTLSLDGVEFRRGDRVLRASNWGIAALVGGACLRIYRQDQTPQDAPSGCTRVFDYPGAANERRLWFEGKVTIVINPSIVYCYPSQECENS